MGKVEVIRQYHCYICDYIKILRKDELPPNICPACQDGRPISWVNIAEEKNFDLDDLNKIKEDIDHEINDE
ncbi:hypothetical protein M0R19_05290 [Candidatus Pacearchaeota archaeon]|jgi:hypothetical protein|nr:hypothetical protein [Candidatus Pacearchaeota archaeon]